MKRKSIILLSSILAGSLLVGGAFAVYAVTDNADPLGINVTPGNLDEDKTQYVTLNWGKSTGLAGVGQLEVGENRKVGVVGLQSTQKYSGVFTLTIEDTTTAEKPNDAAALFDYLNVYVYDGDYDLVVPEGGQPTDEKTALPWDGVSPKATITKDTETTVISGTPARTVKKLSFNIEGSTSENGRPLSIFVNLDDSASPIYNQITKDKVYLEVDWAPQEGDEVTEHVVYYVNSATHWENVYAYAWAGAKVNGAWPGVKMVKLYDDVYQLNIPLGMEKIIFNNGLSGDDERKTADISVPAVIDGEHVAVYEVTNLETYPYVGSWIDEVPEKLPEGDTIVVKHNGEALNFDDIKQEVPQGSTDRAVFKVALEEGDKISAVDGKLTLNFYYWNEAEQRVESLGTEYEAQVAGDRTFYYTADGDIYVGVDYYLVGILNGEDSWTTTDYKLHADAEGQYVLDESIALKSGDKVKVRSSENAYYPGGEETEYNITAAGSYNIYFKPYGGNNDWYYNYFYIGLAA